MAQHFPGSPVPVLGQYPGNKAVGGEVGLETAQISPTNLSLPWKAPHFQPALVSVLLGLVLAQVSVSVIGRCSGKELEGQSSHPSSRFSLDAWFLYTDVACAKATSSWQKLRSWAPALEIM